MNHLMNGSDTQGDGLIIRARNHERNSWVMIGLGQNPKTK